MTTEWDVVADVFPGAQITGKTPPSRRATRVPSSAAVAVVVLACATVGPVTSAVPLLGGISRGSIILSSERASVGKGVSRAPTEVDFPTARSAEQLAKSFEAFFQPAVDHDEDDQVPYAFN
jgi:hypothetical protein